MGLFSKLFKLEKKIPKQQKKIRISFREIDAFLESETKCKKPKLQERVDEFKKKFIRHFKNLEEDFNGLYHANFEQLILEDKRDISKIVETSRKNYCSGSKKLLSNALWYLNNKESAESINNFVSETFNKMNSLSREAQILSTPFREQMKKISSDLKELREETDKYESFLNSDYQIILKEEEAKKLRDKILKKELEKRKSQLERIDAENKLKEFQGKKNKIGLELSKLKNSEKAKKLEKLKSEKVRLERQKNKILSEIKGLISGVSRQIKMYLHKHTVSKTEKTKLDQFLEHPSTLLQGESYLFEIVVRNTKKEIDKLEKDKKKRKKFLEIVQDIERVLENRKKRYREILKQISEKSADIERLTEEINIEEKKGELKRVKDNIRQLEKERRDLERSEKYWNDDKGELLSQLEKLLSEISGKKVKIKNA